MKPFLTIRVSEIFGGKHIVGNGLYVFRDGENILYVGKAESGIANRLKAHLGATNNGLSPIGTLITCNHPESANWEVDIYESEQIVEDERALIRQLRPLLNETHNYEPSSITKGYRTERTAPCSPAESVMRRILGD